MLFNLIKKPTDSKLIFLSLSQSFRNLSASLLAFFSSIFIYRQFFLRTNEVGLSLLAVVLFNLVLYGSKLLSLSFAENMALKRGLKKDIILGDIYVVLSLLMFAFADQFIGLIWLGAIFWGFSIGFFWFGRHGLLSKISSKESFGRCSGSFGALSLLMLLFVPFISGFLIEKFGYQTLFLAAIGFIILSLIAVSVIKEEKTHKDVRLNEIGKLFKTHKRMALSYFSMGAIEAIYSIALLLFVFLSLETELRFGIFYSLSMILVALANLVTGKLIDRKGKRALIAYGAILSAIVWLGRFSTGVIVAFFFFDVIDRIAKTMVGLPLSVLSFEKALEGKSTGRAMLFREIAITIGSLFACLVLVVIFILEVDLKVSFLFAAAFSLLPLLIVGRKKLLGEQVHGL
jgi:MFS family permease